MERRRANRQLNGKRYPRGANTDGDGSMSTMKASKTPRVSDRAAVSERIAAIFERDAKGDLQRCKPSMSSLA